MSLKRFLTDASYRQWPSMTDVERANYLANRALRESEEVESSQAVAVAFWVVALGLAFLYWLVA